MPSGRGRRRQRVYPFVPDIIRYYLKEDPILANVETFRPQIPAHRQHILANLERVGGQGRGWVRKKKKRATGC